MLTSPLVRRKFKRMIEQIAQDLPVLSYGEVEQTVEIHAEGVITLQT